MTCTILKDMGIIFKLKRDFFLIYFIIIKWKNKKSKLTKKTSTISSKSPSFWILHFLSRNSILFSPNILSHSATPSAPKIFTSKILREISTPSRWFPALQSRMESCCFSTPITSPFSKCCCQLLCRESIKSPMAEPSSRSPASYRPSWSHGTLSSCSTK